jgi:methanogenic corrinoid protein MtbC1
MIRWCCYCQTLMGERAPFADYRMTHGACLPCHTRLLAGEPLIAEYGVAIRFYRQLFDAASLGDHATCAAMAKRAQDCGFSRVEILIALLQPALVSIGTKWELGHATVADEHRFTSWCETMLALLERPGIVAGPVDVAILQAPGNRHTLGARIAEQVLLTMGIGAQVLADDLSLPEILRFCREREVAWIGFSCALPQTLAAARALGAQLVAGGFSGGLLFSGQAVRRTPVSAADAESMLCPTIEDARERILGARLLPARPQ